MAANVLCARHKVLCIALYFIRTVHSQEGSLHLSNLVLFVEK